MNDAKQLNIGWFIEAHHPGAPLFRRIDTLARHLSKSVNLTVFTRAVKDVSFAQELPYAMVFLHLPRIPFLNLEIPLHFLDFRFFKALKAANLDLVHLHSGHLLGTIGRDHAKERKIKRIGTLHSGVMKNDFDLSILHPLSEKEADAVTGLYRSCDLLFADHAGIHASYVKSQEKPHPILLSEGSLMHPTKDESQIKTLKHGFGIKSDEKILLTIRSESQDQGIIHLCDALFKLRLKGFRFRWIHVDRLPIDSRLESSIRRNGLDPFNIILDIQEYSDRLSALINMCDLPISASLSDPSFVFIHDAASLKKGVLSLESAMIQPAIQDPFNGWVAPISPTSLSEKIMDILKNPKMMQKVGEKAFQDFHRSSAQYLDLLLETYRHATLKEDPVK